jgi:enoyl-CoA hydratase/carnithine racemase
VSGASSAAFTTLQVEVTGARGRLWLNRPEKLNPLAPATLVELAEAARWFDAPREEKLVVIGGRGRAFSSGADLSPGAGSAVESPREAADAGRRMADAIESMRALTIARIHGHCVGGGVVLASACDLRIAADSARFVIPEVDLGLPLTWGGIPRLVRDIGAAMTKELVLTCRPFDADEARAIGFVNRVVPEAELDAAVDALAATLEQKSALTLEATKRHANAITDGMVGMGRTWNDADSLVAAGSDPESRAAGAAYLKRLRSRGER